MNQIIKPLSCVVVLLAILSGCILRKNFAPLQKGFVASWLEHLLSDNTESLYIKGIRSEETVVIILGYKLRSDGTPTEMLEQRIHTAYDIVKEYEAAKYIIVSGGYPLNWKIHGNSEASSMYQFLSRCYDSDIPTFQEFGSTSTKENAIYSLRLLMNDEKFNKIKRIMITTNLYHQTRAVGVFRKIAAMNEFVSRNFIISGIGGSLISESLPRPTITLRNGVWLPTIVRSCPKYDYYQRYDKIDEFSWAVDLSISTKVCGVIITSNKLLSLSDYKLNMKNNNMQTIRLSLGDKTIQPDKEVLLLLDWKDSSREDDWDYFGPPHITTATLEGNTSPIESFRILKSCSAFSEGSDIIVRSIGVKPPKRHHDWATDFLRETIREVFHLTTSDDEFGSVNCVMLKYRPSEYVTVNGLRYVVPYISNQTYSVKGDHSGKEISQVLGETFRLQRGMQDLDESKRHWQGEVEGGRISLKRRKTHKEDDGPFTSDFENVPEETFTVKEQDKIRMNKHVHERVVSGTQPTLIKDTGNFIIINKPAGIPCVDSQGGINNIIDIAIHELSPQLRPGASRKLHPVHRLDAPVSGILILARGGKHVRLAMNDLRNRLAKKWYLVRIHGRLPPTSDNKVTCDLRISWDSKLNKAVSHPPDYIIKETDNIKSANTSFKTIKTLEDGTTLLLASPETGHRHQIRVHLSSMGFPIVGDMIYGASPVKDSLLQPELYKDSDDGALRLILKESFQEWCPKCQWVKRVLEGENTRPIPTLEPSIHLHALRYIIPSVSLDVISDIPEWANKYISNTDELFEAK